jgi:uncharacterized delta-60 repeat protein
MKTKLYLSPFLLLRTVLAASTFLAQPARAAVTEAWEQRYNGSNNSHFYPNAAAMDGSGNVVVTGRCYSSSGGGADYYTAKYAATDGTLLWEQRYNGPANGNDSANAVAVDANGNVVVTGYSVVIGSGKDYYTAKYAATDGALLWEKRSNGPGHDLDESLPAVALDGSGNVIVAGSSYNGTNYDYYTAKYAAADGALLWEKRYNGPGVSFNFDEAVAVAVDGNGNVAVTGWSHNGTNYDYYTAKYAAADGALLWEQRYDGPANGNDSANAMAVDASGNVVVTGTSDNGTNYDSYTAKYAATDGALVWEKHSYDFAFWVAVDGGGNVAVTGDSNNGTNSDYHTAKYAAADGALLWEKRYNGPANSHDYATAVAVDGVGNVVVTGYSMGIGGSEDFYTVKYAAADGALLWEKRYNGAANGIDGAVSLALGPNGMVVVTGYSAGNTGLDFATIVYRENLPSVFLDKVPDGPRLRFPGVAGSSYQVLRAPAVTGPWSTNAMFIAVANGLIEYIDTNAPPGSAFYRTATAPCTSYAVPRYPDYYTAKHSAASGSLLWEKRFHSLGLGNYGYALAVDGSGNAVVTGYAQSGDAFDYYTAKYAAADGALLWEKRYNGPVASDDRALAVALDANGNVVVTGFSVGSSTNKDYYTAKYAAATGALLWEQRYNGPGAGDDFVGGSHSLALGPSGMVAIAGSSARAAGVNVAVDYATVIYREKLPTVSLDRVPTGKRLRFPGVAGHTYHVLRAPALTGPWRTNATLNAITNGLIEYLDTNAPPGSAFYRTATAP